MQHLVRDLFKKQGYVYARTPAEIAAEFGHKRVARLASNENPWSPSIKTVNAVKEVLNSLNRYPDTNRSEFKEALRTVHGDFNFVAGVGMDGVIETTIRTLINPGDKVVVSTPTFSFYRLATLAQGGVVVEAKRNKNFEVEPDALISAAKGAKLTFLCSPNNPTGNATPVQVIRDILESIDGILFLDNAYVEFCDTDYRPLMKDYDNLIIGRTLSKVFSLAGCRVGYGFLPDWLLPYYNTAATPFALSILAEAAGKGAVLDSEHLKQSKIYVKHWIKQLSEECRFKVFPSDANFLMIDVSPLTGDECTEKLAEKGVIVRSCKSFTGLGENYIRVSVGEEWENEQFLNEINRLKI